MQRHECPYSGDTLTHPQRALLSVAYWHLHSEAVFGKILCAETDIDDCGRDNLKRQFGCLTHGAVFCAAGQGSPEIGRWLASQSDSSNSGSENAQAAPDQSPEHP